VRRRAAKSGWADLFQRGYPTARFGALGAARDLDIFGKKKARGGADIGRRARRL